MNTIFNMLETFQNLPMSQALLCVFVFALTFGLGEVWLLETIDNLYYNYKSNKK